MMPVLATFFPALQTTIRLSIPLVFRFSVCYPLPSAKTTKIVGKAGPGRSAWWGLGGPKLFPFP
jgi:hypothetical protein